MHRVIIAEDDRLIGEGIKAHLQIAGYDVRGIATTVEEAMSLIQAEEPDVAIIDLQLAGSRLGTEVGGHFGTGSPAILYIGGNPDLVELTADDGIAYLTKPFSPADLILAVEIVLSLVAHRQLTASAPECFRLLAPRI